MIKNCCKKGISLLIVSALAVPLISCSKKDEESWVKINERRGYKVHDCIIDNDCTYITEIDNVFNYDDHYYVCVSYHNDSDEGISDELIRSVYVLDSEDNVVDTIRLSDNELPQCIVDDKYVRVDNKNKYEYSLSDGSLINTVEISASGAVSAVPTTNGYIVFARERIVKYDNNDNEIGFVTLTDSVYPSAMSSYYEDNGKEYIVIPDTFYDNYYEVDFDSDIINLVLSTSEISEKLGISNGNHIIDGTADYKVDISNKTIEILADFDYVNIKPEGSGCQSTTYYPFDDNSFAVGYGYYGGSIEIQIMEYDSSIDYSNMEEIEIGGFDLSYDLPLKWAIYKFNTSQDRYRVITTDYTNIFNWMNGSEAQVVTAEMISYFNDGNAPDIFYGSFFDYRNLYNSGLVIDMAPYCMGYKAFESGFMPENIEKLMLNDDVCYSVFAAFYLSGYWGKADIFNTNDVSIYDMQALSEETGILPMAGEYSRNIADSVLRYSVDMRVDDPYSEHVYGTEELVDTLEYAIEYGIPTGSTPGELPNFDLVRADQYLSCLSFMNSIYDLNYYVRGSEGGFVYIGYPSIDGSVRLANPVGQVSISSSSERPDICWQFISMLFDEDVQRIIATNQSIPVSRQVLDELSESTSHPETVDPESPFYSYVHRLPPVDEVTVELFNESVESVNTLLSYDWGVYNIICEEVDSYDLQGKTIQDIAESLQSRIDLYVSENYR